MLVLNAAATGALVALMQALGNDALITYDFRRARTAIVVWAAGILLAFAASLVGYFSQREYTRAFLARRRSVEAHRASVVGDDGDGARAARAEQLARYGLKASGTGVNAQDAARLSSKQRTKADESAGVAELLQFTAYMLGAVAVATAVGGFALAVTSVKEAPKRVASKGFATLRPATPPPVVTGPDGAGQEMRRDEAWPTHPVA